MIYKCDIQNINVHLKHIAFFGRFFSAFLEITVDIDRIVLLGDKSLKSFRKFGKRFSHTIFLDRFHELFIADITILFDSFSKIRIMFRVKINPSLFLQVVNSQIFLSCLLFNFMFSIPSCTAVCSGHFWKEKKMSKKLSKFNEKLAGFQEYILLSFCGELAF